MVLALLVSGVLGGLLIGALGGLVAPSHAEMGLAATLTAGCGVYAISCGTTR